MRNDLNKIKKEVMKIHKNYQRYIMLLIFLSVLVAFAVSVSLIRPAVSTSHICGLEQHIHDEMCYEHAHISGCRNR